MIVFLIRNLEQSVDTMGMNILLAIFPLHLLALSLGGHLADGLGHRLALPLDHGDLGWLMLDGLKEDRILSRSTIICGNFDRHFAFLQSAIFPGHISAIFIAGPDLVSIVIDYPLGVTLLFGHINTNWHLLQFRNWLAFSLNTVPRKKLLDMDVVIVNTFLNRYILKKQSF